MALPSCHVDSPEDTQPGTTFQCRYPTCRHIGGMARIGEKGRAVSSQEQMEIRRWEEEQELHQGGYRGLQTPQTKKGLNRPAPCLSTNDKGLIAWNRRLRP